MSKEKKATYLFSLRGIFSILRSLLLRGVNLFAILETRTKLNPDKLGLVYEGERYTYLDIYEKTVGLIGVFTQKYHLKSGRKAAIICSNSFSQVLSIFALAGMGIDIYLLNVEMPESLFIKMVERHKFDVIIHDSSITHYIENNGYKDKYLSIADIAQLKSLPRFHFKKRKTNVPKIVVLTSGTTGVSTRAERKPSFLPYIRIFRSLLKKLQLNSYNSLYIGIPLYHGFGLIALLSAIALGKHIYLSPKFDAVKTCNSIREENIDVITLVPTMLQRMLAYNPSSLKSLKCIISGGAMLPPRIVETVQEHFGDILFNLYGTSETSISLVASPQNLRYSPCTLGKALSGVEVRIVDNEGQEVRPGIIGQIQIKSDCSIHPGKWINTGDMGYIDNNGYYFLKGRNDDMIVSGGENVFPSELEDILSRHPQIDEAVVIGISDEEFGQRLKAFIVVKIDTDLSEQDIHVWLSERTARYHIPKTIVFLPEIPLNAVGKPDKKKLAEVR